MYKKIIILGLICFFVSRAKYLSGEAISLVKKDKPSIKNSVSGLYNSYGRLLEDDPDYNKKFSVWLPISEVIGINAAVWSFDRFVANYDYGNINIDTWKHNLSAGWAWDSDGLGMNFFDHPLAGGAYFNTARSCGYDFYESVPFAFGGSLIWEYLGENELPSYNDLINTTLSGPFFGEIQYRLSSSILNDKTTGAERIWREVAAGIVDPVRVFNRLIQGKTSKKSDKEVYQKEPITVTISAGVRIKNDGSSFGTGPGNSFAEMILDYGDAFERRERKPYDYFRLQTAAYFNVGTRSLNNLMGYAVLTGDNTKNKDLEMLLGLFQHYDYWDSSTFELATLAFGPGIISRLPVKRNSELLVNVQLGLIPLAGNSTSKPIDIDGRDYNYGQGMEGKVEFAFKLDKKFNIMLNEYYYWIHSTVGQCGDNFVGIAKPAISYNITDSLLIGFEDMIYTSNTYPRNLPSTYTVNTEQKLYLSLYFQDPMYDK